MTRSSDLRALWPPVLLFSALLAGVLAFANLDSPLRAVIVLWFMLVCPGLALIRLAHLADPVAELAVGIALSVALASVVAAALLYAGAWSPQAVLGVLIAATVTGVGLDVGRRRA